MGTSAGCRRSVVEISAGNGAPEEIRTPDPQIRSLVAPTLLALRLIVPNVGPAAASIVDEIFEVIVATLVL